MLLERIARGDIDPSYLATHHMPLDKGPEGYDIFKHNKHGCFRVILPPAAQ
jgi:threonine dehydrogenase-like Zn-dependent dehydrogenase